jgi:hypothetical protein
LQNLQVPQELLERLEQHAQQLVQQLVQQAHTKKPPGGGFFYIGENSAPQGARLITS